MRKILFLMLMVLSISYAKAQFPAPYCAEAYSSGVEPITSVAFNTINNTSSATVGGTAHEDYTAISTNVTQGGTYSITLKGNSDGNYANYYRVFADWNQDGDFLDAGESFDIGIITNSTGTDALSVTGSITVPPTATLGNTRMRIGKKYGGYQSPCNTAGFGQAEDYTLNVQVANTCSGTPTAGTASATIQYLCTAGTSILNLSGVTAASGLTYQWQSSATGANTWSDISGATTVPYTASVSASTDYRCVVTCTNGGASANSTVVTVILGSVPTNDDFCSAQTLVLDAASVCGNTTCATATGDPTFANSTPNNTIWYKYTPTTSGVVNFIMTRPSGITSGLLYGWLGIYTATGTCPTLTFTEVTSNLSYNLTTQTSVTLVSPSLTAGTTYYFMIDGFSGASGAFCIQMTTPPTPPACTTNISPADAATNVDYTTLPGVKLKWNTVSGATGYDLYFGTVNPPTTLLGSTTADSVIVTGVAASTTYYWYIAPKNNGGQATGCSSNTTSFTTAAPPAPPANDDCAAAVTISQYGGSVSGTTLSATQTLAASTTCTSTTALDVWYKFTTLTSGNATITVVGGTGLDAIVEAFSGACGSLTTISCADLSSSAGTETLNLTSLAAATTYYVRVSGWNNTSGTFTISASGTALPVSFVNISGERKENMNVISWTTATETNNLGFELQRSADGRNFNKIAFIESKATNGNSNQQLSYVYSDTKPFNATGYYRLNQIDKDGKSHLSNVVVIKGNKVSQLELSSVYPNPTNKEITVSLISPKADNISLVIYDITGKVVLQQNKSINLGDNLVNLDVSSLANGTYTLKAICNNGCETALSKFVKF